MSAPATRKIDPQALVHVSILISRDTQNVGPQVGRMPNKFPLATFIGLMSTPKIQHNTHYC